MGRSVRKKESACVSVCVYEKEDMKSASILTYFQHSDYVITPISRIRLTESPLFSEQTQSSHVITVD